MPLASRKVRPLFLVILFGVCGFVYIFHRGPIANQVPRSAEPAKTWSSTSLISGMDTRGSRPGAPSGQPGAAEPRDPTDSANTGITSQMTSQIREGLNVNNHPLNSSQDTRGDGEREGSDSGVQTADIDNYTSTTDNEDDSLDYEEHEDWRNITYIKSGSQVLFPPYLYSFGVYAM